MPYSVYLLKPAGAGNTGVSTGGIGGAVGADAAGDCRA